MTLLAGCRTCLAQGPNLSFQFAELAAVVKNQANLGLIVDIGRMDGLFLSPCNRLGPRPLRVDRVADLAEGAPTRGVEMEVGYFSAETATDRRDKHGWAAAIVTTDAFNSISNIHHWMAGVHLWFVAPVMIVVRRLGVRCGWIRFFPRGGGAYIGEAVRRREAGRTSPANSQGRRLRRDSQRRYLIEFLQDRTRQSRLFRRWERARARSLFSWQKYSIRSPEPLEAEWPNVLLIFARHFFDEMRQQQKKVAAYSGRFLVPLPSPVLVN